MRAFVRRAAVAAFSLSLYVTATTSADAAPAAPRGAHPRIWLGSQTLAALQPTLADPSSGAARAVARCKQVAGKPDRSTNGDDWTWSFGAASCGLAWQLTHDASAADTGVTLFRALLDDYTSVGDGAGGDTAVTHDSGYDIRVFGPYAALAYDWLHDAPGVDDALRAHARDRFKAWIDWYAQNGYLNDTPGANYHAGYVFAKALIAIAAAGEDAGAADTYWKEVVDTQFGAQIVGEGLAAKGPMVGGDWPEGWQYGPLSVLEYALAARALAESGAAQPAMGQWASDTVLAYLYATPPGNAGVFTDGDLDNDQPLAAPNPRPMLVALAGPGGDDAASWAASYRASTVMAKEDCPVFDALADARGVAKKDFTAGKPPLWYLAQGTRKLFVRSSWDAAATFAYFTSAPRLVPDHQHVDSSNFVLFRGGDPIVADPSPYGSLSTLTGNAITVDSNVIDPKAKPSQSIWENQADLPWARATSSGIAAARADLAAAFDGVNGKPSDVPFARRDWTYLPEGDVVTIDRARTGDASRGMHLRFRTPATLSATSTTPYVASGASGGSNAIVRAVTLSGGTPKLRSVAGGGSCDNVTWGQCDAARFAVSEYSLDVPGPQMLAVHAISGTAKADAAPKVAPLDDPSVGGTENAGVVGAMIDRGTARTFVVASSGQDGAVAGGALAYAVPGDAASRHVVFDAPEDAAGKSVVTATVENGRCAIRVTAGDATHGFAGRPLVFQVSAGSAGCLATEDAAAPPATAGPGQNGGPPNGPGADGANGGDSGGCSTTGSGSLAFVPIGAALALVAFARRRRRARA